MQNLEECSAQEGKKVLRTQFSHISSLGGDERCVAVTTTHLITQRQTTTCYNEGSQQPGLREAVFHSFLKRRFWSFCFAFSSKHKQKYCESDCPSHKVRLCPELLISGAILTVYSQPDSMLDNLLDLNWGAGHHWWNWYRNNRSRLAPKQLAQLYCRYTMPLQARLNKKNATSMK